MLLYSFNASIRTYEKLIFSFLPISTKYSGTDTFLQTVFSFNLRYLIMSTMAIVFTALELVLTSSNFEDL